MTATLQHLGAADSAAETFPLIPRPTGAEARLRVRLLEILTLERQAYLTYKHVEQQCNDLLEPRRAEWVRLAADRIEIENMLNLAR